MTKAKALEIVLGVGTFAWWRCGESKNMPWCDGKHKNKTFNPFIGITIIIKILMNS